MKRINFVCQWSINKEKTWSGTCYSLYKNLNKKIHVKNVSYNSFFYKIFIRLGLLKRDLGSKYICFNRKFNKRLRFKENDIIFQFDDYVNTGCSYKYIDSSLGYLIYLYEKDHDLFNHSNFKNTSIEAMKIRYEIEKEYFHNEATGIFTMSKWLRDYLIEQEKLPVSKVHYAGGGVNVDISRIDNSNKNGKRFLFIGRDFERKGGFLVIEAFKKLQKNYSDIELYIAGPNSNPISEEISNYYFLGDVPSFKLPELYNLCDYFVLPSYFEMYGLVFVEALTFGLPCIGRNAYEMKYFIENAKSGFLVETNEIQELYTYMERFFLQGDEFKKYVNEKREYYLKEYSWETVADRIVGVINNDE